MTVKNNKHSHSSKYISVGRGYSVMFYSVMLSLAVLILVGSFCHCTSAKSIEGDWSSLDPLHDEQQDARIATLSASQLLTELVFRLDIVECPVAEPSQKLAIKNNNTPLIHSIYYYFSALDINIMHMPSIAHHWAGTVVGVSSQILHSNCCSMTVTFFLLQILKSSAITRMQGLNFIILLVQKIV